MNFFEGEKYKLILGLTSVGIVIYLMLPACLLADHFRYGTMSWELVDNDTIRFKQSNGWTNTNQNYNQLSDFELKQVAGYVGSIDNRYDITWGGGSGDTTTRMHHKILSRSDTSGSTITEVGVYNNSSGQDLWTRGITRDYDNGTYVVYWNGNDREDVINSANGVNWRNEMLIRIGGDYIGNNSPTSAIEPIVSVQDEKEFTYDVIASDADGDALYYRWGQHNEFFVKDGTGSTNDFVMPTGMTLETKDNKGVIKWDVRNSAVSTTTGDLWVAVIMVEDRLDNGTVKSRIPLDFFFKITDPSDDPPVISGIPSLKQTVPIETTKTFTLTSTDDSGVAPTFSITNPPSDNSSIFSTSTSNSLVNGDNTTTFTITFRPDSSMGGYTESWIIVSTDNAGITKAQAISIQVSTVSNANPTSPTLVEPANGATVVKPVSFQWTKSTDSDNDTVSYSFYLCTDIGFVGCSGTTFAAGINILMPPFNQNLQESLISWPRYLEAAPIYQQISKDISMIPKWLIMLTAFGLMSGIISFSLKNISRRKLVFMLILLLFLFSLNINSCARSDNSTSEIASTSDKSSSTTDNTTSSSGDTNTTATSVTINNNTYTTSDITNNTTYYWKVVASDPKGGSAESATWSFTVQ